MKPGRNSPVTTQELVSQMNAHYRAFLLACKELSQVQALNEGVCGEWSAKAVVDHLTGWQEESLSILKDILKPGITDFDIDIDAFNRAAVKEKENFTWDESLKDFQTSFELFVKNLEEILISQVQVNEGLKSWLKAMSYEYQFHISHILAAKNFRN